MLQPLYLARLCTRQAEVVTQRDAHGDADLIATNHDAASEAQPVSPSVLLHVYALENVLCGLTRKQVNKIQRLFHVGALRLQMH